jgi:hypothetical protein
MQTVVDQDSATLGYSNEIRVALNGDHCSIAKYSSDTDPNYRRVSGRIALIVKGRTLKGLYKGNLLPPRDVDYDRARGSRERQIAICGEPSSFQK